ncbi:2-phospho-L-lactate guanylyltransferase [Aquihabitans sp. McL0605]|uniref:2-phospho-L-lactate guanylyltransferase n=1 Tax=Aquihabitans sp. McL0605 TaxID=3415671 RepID=UPI003CF7F26D
MTDVALGTGPPRGAGSVALVNVAVVIPVKAFHEAKLRLAPALSPEARAVLAREMATRVVRAAGSMPVTVVCDDDAVRAWATEVGAAVHWTPGLGLIGAVEAGVEAVTLQGAGRILVAHADLPLATGLDHVVGSDGVVIVPDRWNDGTNVITIPAGCGFRFAYGAGSCERHRGEAARLGLPVAIVDDQVLSWDVDLPDDLQLPGGEDLAAGLAS